MTLSHRCRRWLEPQLDILVAAFRADDVPLKPRRMIPAELGDEGFNADDAAALASVAPDVEAVAAVGEVSDGGNPVLAHHISCQTRMIMPAIVPTARMMRRAVKVFGMVSAF